MKAKEFLKEWRRMCEAHPPARGTCNRCPAYYECTIDPEKRVPKNLIAIVKRWSEEHPEEVTE